jgi:hypothetical protein
MKTVFLIIGYGLSLAYSLYTHLARRLLELPQDVTNSLILIFESLGDVRLAHCQKTFPPRSPLLPHYISGQAQPAIVSAPSIRPEKWINTQRQIGMLCQRVLERLSLGKRGSINS